jgi:hypothetical protein
MMNIENRSSNTVHDGTGNVSYTRYTFGMNEGFEGQDEVKRPESPWEDRVNRAETFEQLYDVLKEAGEIPGGHRTYISHEIIQRIETIRMKVQDGTIKPEALIAYGSPKNITRTWNIRDKVDELLFKILKEKTE